MNLMYSLFKHIHSFVCAVGVCSYLIKFAKSCDDMNSSAPWWLHYSHYGRLFDSFPSLFSNTNYRLTAAQCEFVRG